MLRPTIDDCLADAAWSQQCLQHYIAEDKISDFNISEFCSRKHLMPEQHPESETTSGISQFGGAHRKENNFMSKGIPCQSERTTELSTDLSTNPSIGSRHTPPKFSTESERDEYGGSSRTKIQERRTYRRLRGIISDSEQREHRREQV
jgi:hypothetical protein